MNLQSLKPAKDFAIRFGVKAVVYGPAGSGKTPIINTAPRPLLLACEPGLLSMRNSMVPTFQAFTAKLIDEFFEWFFKSTETKNFDTIAVDSGSHMAEVYLERAKQNNKHGLAAYGQMAEDSLEHLNGLYWMQQKHVYLIAKQEITDKGFKRPYFPGRQLPIEMPHKYDQILNLDIHNIPGMGQYKAFRCWGTIDTLARDRTGMLNEFEEPNFGKLVQKAMS